MPPLPRDDETRAQRARASLNGLSAGDGFGERFFWLDVGLTAALRQRILPEPPWRYTDDTVMALSIVEVLEARGHIDQDLLASAFSAKYAADPNRGYGISAHTVLGQIAQGTDWQSASRAAFDGEGSFGNGGAMRAAPIGAYFEGDPATAAAEADRAASITHAHLEGRAGAGAVAAAASLASSLSSGRALIEATIEHTPAGLTRDGLSAALTLSLDTDVQTAVTTLGNGSRVCAQDTVPFCLWCAARHLDNFEEAMWNTVSGLGDRDTTCAIVAGIISARAGDSAPPRSWLEARESLDTLAGIGMDAA